MTEPSYDDLLPSDLEALDGAGDRELAEWYHELNGSGWPKELPPAMPERWASQEDWEAAQPDRRDDLMQWIKNKVGIKYLLMVWQTEKMLVKLAPEVVVPDEAFEAWWNAPYYGDPSRTNGQERLRSEEWWATTREEWRSMRKGVDRLKPPV